MKALLLQCSASLSEIYEGTVAALLKREAREATKAASERQHIHMCPRIHREDQNIIISDTGLGLGQGDRRQTCQQGSQ